nr:MAG: nonstructural protein [Microvirus sp.]
MKLLICSVLDKAAECFGSPVFTVSKGTAHRSFVDEVNRQSQDNVMFAHPEHFDLYCLGEFENSTAEFNVFPQPQLIVRGSEVRHVSE